MAGQVLIGQTAEILLTAATIRTVLQVLAPTNIRVKVKRWGVFFDGVSVTGEPVQVELLRQTTAGTMSALTLVKKLNLGSETIQTTATHSATSTEPTASDIYDAKEVHPQQGYEYIFPLGTAPANVNVRAVIELEE
jgi:hypothetical protein